MSQNQQFDLLEKYLSGTASPAEMAMIDQWLNDVHIDNEWDSCTDGEKKEIVSGMYHDIRKSIQKNGRTVSLWRKYAWQAAASVILILGASIWYWRTDMKREKQIAGIENRSKPADILPGGNKATLTLADGSTVILDSTHNGNITHQGNVTVIKLDDGQLAYNPTTHNAPPTTLIYNTITTPRGGQYQVVLADGSKVWLNAASSLTFPTSFPGKERDVKITGEAYFEVAHNAQKPFRVSVNDMTVEVLGTHFNINGYADEGVVKTTLLEGKVKVDAAGQSALLKPGQQARLEISNQQLETRNGVDLDEVMAWKNGLFYFNKAGIRQIMSIVSRWYDVEITIEDNVPEKKFSGKIYRNVNASEIFRILEEGGIHIHVVGKRVIVSG